MTKGEYIDRVLALLNEAVMADRDGFDFEGADDSEVVKQITDVYVYAWRKCLSVVPKSWANVRDFGEPPHDEGDGSGWLTLPEDWYTLYCFRMKGWQREVYRSAQEGDELARLQKGQFLRGTPLHPVCVEGYNGEGVRVLRYYSLSRGTIHDIETALYVPMCQRIDALSNDSDLGLDERMKDVFCYFAASLVCIRFENYNTAKVMEREAVTLTHGILIEHEPPKV